MLALVGAVVGALLVLGAVALTVLAGAGPAGRGPAGSGPAVAPLGQLRHASLLVVAPFTISPQLAAGIAATPGVIATEPMDAGRISLDGVSTVVAGVDPATFRAYASPAMAAVDETWQSVAAGGLVLSQPPKGLRPGDSLIVKGPEQRVRVVAFASTGVGGVGAVVSHAVARALGLPVRNALIVSTGAGDVTAVMTRIQALLPPGAAIAPQGRWVATAVGNGTRATGSLMTRSQVAAVLRAALSRRGMPYVWAAAGPNSFDCSGLVRWAFAQARLTVPRVAADQALAGPAVPVSELAPGDLLFYRTEQDRPGYISHVAIYLGGGLMIQAPRTGENVEVAPADFGTHFAGALQVSPQTASSLADVVA